MNEGFSRGVALEGRNDSMLEHQPKARKSFLYRYFIKRLLDITLILASAPFTVPVVFVLAVMVWAQGGQPFYTQSRIGYKGREFRSNRPIALAVTHKWCGELIHPPTWPCLSASDHDSSFGTG